MNQTPPNIALPPELRGQIERFERRLRRIETVVTVCGALAGFLASFGLLFLSDRLWDTPMPIRALLTLAGIGGSAWLASVWVRHWVVNRRGPRDLARLVQMSIPQLGDRILGAVELSEGRGSHSEWSPALVEAAIRQINAEAGRYDFEQAVNRRASRRASWAAVALIALVVTPFMLFPKAGWNALSRWANPFGDVRRFTFVSLMDMPDSLIVPHGEPFFIESRLDPDSSSRPEIGSARFLEQEPIIARFNDDVARFEIPGQTRRGPLVLRIGDVSRRIEIIPSHRPELVGLTAKVILPEYLQRPPETQSISGTFASFLQGSRVTFEGKVSRDLVRADVVEPTPVALAVEGATFRTSPVDVTEAGRLSFSWTDELNLASATPYRVEVMPFSDRVPIVECEGVSRNVAMLQDEVMQINLKAQDDFGLEKLWVSWRTLPGAVTNLAPIAVEQDVATGSPLTGQLGGAYTFSPMASGIPEDTLVSFTAFTRDYFPGREPVGTYEYRFYVMNRAMHAKMIQDRMEAVMARIEDIAREQEALAESTEKLSQASPAEMGEEKTGEKAEAAKQQQERNKEALRRLAQESKDVLKDAMRNRDIPESTMREWGEMSESLDNISKNEMQQASQKLDQASQSPQKRKENLDEAKEQQKEAARQLRKMEKEADDTIQNMIARSFINRLREAATEEEGIAADLSDRIGALIGALPSQLSSEDQAALETAADRQGTTRRQAGYIQDDLGGFYNRTRDPVYNEILQEMIGTEMGDNLDKLKGLISENVTLQSIDLATLWKDRFNAWANLLEEKAGESEDGEPSQAEVDIETLLALIRARYKEESIREHTRMMEEEKSTRPTYARDARKLATDQSQLSADMGVLERRVEQENLRMLINKITGEMMNVSVRLRRPDTGKDTVAIQTEIIELLSQSIQQSQGSQSGAGMSMMAMLGMAPGPGGGQGSLAGGMALAAGTDQGGDKTGGGGGDAGEASRSSGIDASQFPAEFRAPLETYFNSLEAAP